MGHTRALTMVKYNHDGDLLVSASKDHQLSIWYTKDGERLGTFDGHSGALWAIDISRDSSRLLTGSADFTMRLWSVQNGTELFRWQTKSAVRAVSFSIGDKHALFLTDAIMGEKSTIHIIKIEEDYKKQTSATTLKFLVPGTKATKVVWGKCNETIIAGHEDGTVTKFDAKTGKVLISTKQHSGQITDIQFGITRDYFITASKDHSAIIFKSSNLELFKMFETSRPVNSAAISPYKPHVMLGGGQDAMSVTTTSTRSGQFEVRFYHLVFEEEIGRVKGHFGPINTLAFHPSGTGYASGGEDGYVRLHHFDSNYDKFRFPEEIA